MGVSLLVASVLVGLVSLSEECSIPLGGYVPPTLDAKVMESGVVLHGVALSTRPDNRFPGGNVYSVEFDVRCIYKGSPVDSVIWIDQAGSIPGHCFSKDLEVGKTHLVYLRQTSEGRYQQIYTADPGTGEYLEEIMFLCDTKITYPKGINEHNGKEKCLQPSDTTECQPHSVVSEPPAPEPGSSENTEHPVIAPSREDNGNNACTALTGHLVPLLLVLSIFLL